MAAWCQLQHFPVTAGSLHGLAWSLTNRAYQTPRFARTLLLHAIARADQLGVESLKLDATDQGQPLYES